MALQLRRPDPADIRDARRNLHREALIRGAAFIPESATPAARAALEELVDEGVATRHGDRGVSITDDTDMYRAARAVMLEMETADTLSVNDLHDRIEHTAASTADAVAYLRAHKLVAFRDGALTDRTGDKMRGRKTALPTASLELAAIAARDEAVRKNVEALGDSTTRWFKHPDDDRWTTEALRDIRRETNQVFRKLPPAARWEEPVFRGWAAESTTVPLNSVMARLEAVGFIAVADGYVTTSAALPEPVKPAPKPVIETTPEPVVPSLSDDVGDIAATDPAPVVPEVIESKPEVVEPAPKAPETPVADTAKSGVPSTEGTSTAGTGAATTAGTKNPDPALKSTPEVGDTPAPSTPSTAVAKREPQPVQVVAPAADMTPWLTGIEENTRALVQLLAAPQASARQAVGEGALLFTTLRRVMVLLARHETLTHSQLKVSFDGKLPEKRKALDVALNYGVGVGALAATGAKNPKGWGARYTLADPTRVGIARHEILNEAMKPRVKKPVTAGK